jgi:hypothetical protein
VQILLFEVNFNVLYNVMNDETFKKGSEGIPWRGGRRKPMQELNEYYCGHLVEKFYT